MKNNRSPMVLGILLTVILILPCSGATGVCNGVNYDKDIYRCEYGELIGKCKGKDYYVAYDKCVNGVVVSGTASSDNSGIFIGSRGTFTDSRDGKKYKATKIGVQTWMAENLNYNVNGSKCYDNNPANCQKYGRLYNWNTAKVACPKSWHLPTNAEWEALAVAAGGEKIAGKFLKATGGWNGGDFGTTGNGTDAYGFSALPGGFGGTDGDFGNIGDFGNWWSSSEFEYNSTDAYIRFMTNFYEAALKLNPPKTYLESVRCVQD